MATLKISDLSVGDWVYYDKGNTPYSIRGIYHTGRQDCVVLNDEKYSDGVIAFVDKLTPIPITAEILEKNGFFSDRLAGWCKCELGDILRTRIEVHIGAVGVDRIEISSVDAFDEDWSTLDVMINKPIKGVHQLQHALRLAGVDKEINL